MLSRTGVPLVQLLKSKTTLIPVSGSEKICPKVPDDIIGAQNLGILKECHRGTLIMIDVHHQHVTHCPHLLLPTSQGEFKSVCRTKLVGPIHTEHQH